MMSTRGQVRRKEKRIIPYRVITSSLHLVHSALLQEGSLHIQQVHSKSSGFNQTRAPRIRETRHTIVWSHAKVWDTSDSNIIHDVFHLLLSTLFCIFTVPCALVYSTCHIFCVLMVLFTWVSFYPSLSPGTLMSIVRVSHLSISLSISLEYLTWGSLTWCFVKLIISLRTPHISFYISIVLSK